MRNEEDNRREATVTSSDLVEAPAHSFGQFLMKALNDKDVPVEKLKLLLEAQQLMVVEQARVAYQEAFSRFSDQMEQATKDKIVDMKDKGKFPFTTMAEIDRIARPRLSAERLSLNFTFAQDTATKMISVTGHLKGYGYEEQSTLSGMPDKGPGRDDIQAVGSTVSKLSRYIAIGLLNIVRAEDLVIANTKPPERLYEPYDDARARKWARDLASAEEGEPDV